MDWFRFPPVATIRAFTAYAERGSLEKAGQALNVSHAAISQQLKALEAHTGLALVDRSGRQMRFTDEGAILAKTLTEAFATMETTLDALTGADADRPVQISVTPSFASAWLMPRLSGFREHCPQTSLMIDPSPALIPLEPGGIDVAIRYGKGQWPGLNAIALLPSPIAIVAAPKLIGDQNIASPEELINYHWLQELGTSEASEWLSHSGLPERGESGISSLPGNLLLEAARQGQGVAIAAHIFVKQDIEAGRLRLLFLQHEEKSYHIVTRLGPLRPPVKAFVQWLQRQV
jgi:LysR family glycine cleavage system transcriptional activator